MKLIFCYWNSMMEQKFTQAFESLGHEVIPFRQELDTSNKDYDKDYLKNLIAFATEQNNIAFVLSINFTPIISRACRVLKLPYISWLCDCPLYSLYSNTLREPQNHTFFFDRMHSERFKAIYPDANIYYLPGACDPESFCNIDITENERQKYNHDVSFVGSLYSEKGTHERISASLPPYLMGYADGIINAQLNVYGYNFMEDSISDDFIDAFKNYTNFSLPSDYRNDAKGMIADYYFGYRSTMLDRIKTLKAVSERFDTYLYTTSDTSMLPNIHNMGIADSGSMLPKIYNCSKINLEITSKTFRSGITLRLFEIMCAGGFVIANYQSEMLEYFTPGKDIVIYESIPDLLCKIDYYLSHEDERQQIAKNGQENVLKHHTYHIRTKEILDVLKQSDHCEI